jgi:ketosteroid isomerase-like protein
LSVSKSESNVELVRKGFVAAARGDIGVVTGMLAPEVRWHGAGDEHGGALRAAGEG